MSQQAPPHVLQIDEEEGGARRLFSHPECVDIYRWYRNSTPAFTKEAAKMHRGQVFYAPLMWWVVFMELLAFLTANTAAARTCWRIFLMLFPSTWSIMLLSQLHSEFQHWDCVSHGLIEYRGWAGIADCLSTTFHGWLLIITILIADNNNNLDGPPGICGTLAIVWGAVCLVFVPMVVVLRYSPGAMIEKVHRRLDDVDMMITKLSSMNAADPIKEHWKFDDPISACILRRIMRPGRVRDMLIKCSERTYTEDLTLRLGDDMEYAGHVDIQTFESDVSFKFTPPVGPLFWHHLAKMKPRR
jgi:hypothetical protein